MKHAGQDNRLAVRMPELAAGVPFYGVAPAVKDVPKIKAALLLNFAGHYLFGNSWDRLLADYNVFRGRIWVFVLVANLLAPLWAFWQRAPAQ